MSKSKTTQTVSLPAWQESQMKELYAAGKGLAGQPFVPYTGPMVAGFNPDQLRQFQATRGLFETGMQYDPLTGIQQLAQAPTPTVGQVPSLLQADIAAYQSPYQQQVIDVALGDIQRQADVAQQQAQERAIRAGAFGGSRSALLEAEAARPYAEQAARTVAGLRQAGFEQAQRAAESDIARQMQMAQFAPQFELQARAQQAGLLGALGGEQMQRLGLLGGIGAQQQALQQQALQVPYQEFQRALAYGPQQLGLLQAGLGTPLTSQTVTGKQDVGLGGILGGLTGLAGAALMGGINPFAGLLGGAGATGGAIGGVSTAQMGLSDKRLKKDITLIGKEKGHNIYTWKWNDVAESMGVNDPTIGVIAQEVMKYMPEAVVKDDNGYYMVNYAAL